MSRFKTTIEEDWMGNECTRIKPYKESGFPCIECTGEKDFYVETTDFAGADFSITGGCFTKDCIPEMIAALSKMQEILS